MKSNHCSQEALLVTLLILALIILSLTITNVVLQCRYQIIHLSTAMVPPSPGSSSRTTVPGSTSLMRAGDHCRPPATGRWPAPKDKQLPRQLPAASGQPRRLSPSLPRKKRRRSASTAAWRDWWRGQSCTASKDIITTVAAPSKCSTELATWPGGQSTPGLVQFLVQFLVKL